ncbi:MAG: hypothetical protein HY886_04570 [Deltaproteobacteria bacterium]|nr:hypothetical protein [Deltaproteobacteria bacterium]
MMQTTLRPVKIGLFFGLLNLLFGIFWAAYITINHEAIHNDFTAMERAGIEQKAALTAPKVETPLHEHGAKGHAHDKGAHHEVKEQAVKSDHHGSARAGEAHERLTRGHIHAMGLGLVTIAVSLILAFITAGARLKTLGSVSAGVGGFLYPFAWIIMGYRTVTLGAAAAAESVLPITALSVALVATGLLISMFFVVRAILKGEG